MSDQITIDRAVIEQALVEAVEAERKASAEHHLEVMRKALAAKPDGEPTNDCAHDFVPEAKSGISLCIKCGAIERKAKDNWRQYAKPGESAQACIERHRKEHDALLELLKQARTVPPARTEVEPVGKAFKWQGGDAFTYCMWNAEAVPVGTKLYTTPPTRVDGWKHDCAALLTNDIRLWIDRCPHCGKPAPQPTKD